MVPPGEGMPMALPSNANGQPPPGVLQDGVGKLNQQPIVPIEGQSVAKR